MARFIAEQYFEEMAEIIAVIVEKPDRISTARILHENIYEQLFILLQAAGPSWYDEDYGNDLACAKAQMNFMENILYDVEGFDMSKMKTCAKDLEMPNNVMFPSEEITISEEYHATLPSCELMTDPDEHVAEALAVSTKVTIDMWLRWNKRASHTPGGNKEWDT